MNGCAAFAVSLLAIAGCGADAEPEAAAGHRAVIDANAAASWQRYGEYAEVDMGLDATEPRLVADMIAHHLDAVDGSAAYLASADDDEVRRLATRIERVQAQQVATMRVWLDEWGAGDERGEWAPMFDDEATSDPVAYLTTMIEHHHHALAMYLTWVNSDVIEHDEFGRLLRDVARGQVGEIAAMCQMLGRRDADLPLECGPR